MWSAQNITRGASLGGVDLWSGLTGATEANRINEMNYALSRENYEWQKYVQQQTWEREDNAFTRKVADLRNAGLSPILATSGASGSPTGGVVSTQAPKQDYQRVNLMEMVQTAISIISMVSNVGKTLADTNLATEKAKGETLTNVIKGVDAVNSAGSGVGDKGSGFGKIFKDFFGITNKEYPIEKPSPVPGTPAGDANNGFIHKLIDGFINPKKQPLNEERFKKR